tara:strand:+ start:351 stop:905 length:555 start_codon:yes stop_codon:yes gene_type:complete
MFHKKTLVDQSVITNNLSSTLPINFDKININILENFYYKNCQNNNDDSYLKDYYHLEYDKQITWISDYIRDHYRLNYKKTPVLLSFAGLVVRQNESINYHNHIDEYDLEHSPDMTAVITCKTGDKPSFLEFEYEYARKRHQKHRVLLKTKQIVMFDSNLRHSYIKNLNHEPVLNLCLKYQLIEN